MEKLLKKLDDLAKISSELEPSEKKRQYYNNRVHNYTNEFINSLPTRAAYKEGDPSTKQLSLEKTTKSLETVLDIYDEEVVKKGIIASSGGHLGYIPGGGIFTSALADYLVDVTNEYAGIYFGSPGAVTIENELIDWMKNMFDFPKHAIGNLTSGGSIANLIALTAARDKHKIKNKKIKKSVIYLSAQVHHCIHKSLRIIGLEDIIIRHIDLDENHKIKIDQLDLAIKTDIESGLNPFLVVASAGTTDTGAVDPLDKIAEVSKKYKLWFHIDAAYGGFFIMVAHKKHLFKGIEKADSLVIDPHKGLFLPYGLGAVLVKDKKAVYHSNHYFANYMQDAFNESVVNPADVSPELTKHFRGLRLWLPLQLHGIEPFKACLEEKLLLTEYFRIHLVELGFKIGPQPDLSVSYFWFPIKTIEKNIFNKKLLEFIHKDGRHFLSSTVLNDVFVIRMAILSFRTKRETIDATIKMISENLNMTKSYFNVE